MTDSAAAESIVQAGGEIRCHRCSYYCGESPIALRLVGIVKRRDLVDLIPPLRAIWLCARCGWRNLYESLTTEPKMV